MSRDMTRPFLFSYVSRMRTYGMSHKWMSESHIWMSMSHIWMSQPKGMSEYVTWLIHFIFRQCTYEQWMCGDVHESCRTCHVPLHEWVMSRIWMSHVAHITYLYMNESCHVYEWVMSHISRTFTWMSHVTYMNESCRTCHVPLHEWVMSHMETYLSCVETYGMSHKWISQWHVTYMNESA